jgi:hypothetical protein
MTPSFAIAVAVSSTFYILFLGNEWIEAKERTWVVMLFGTRRVGNTFDNTLVAGNLHYIAECSENGVFG